MSNGRPIPKSINPANLVPVQSVTAQRAGFSPLQQLGKYDKGISSAIYEGTLKNPYTEQMYYRGYQQSIPSKLTNGLISRAASVPIKLASGIVSTVGLVKGAFEGDVSQAWDNSILEAFNGLDQNLKEALPANVSRTYSEGNWITKMGTASFWANDAFDGLAFLASAAVPGTVFSKIGSVSKALQATKAANSLGKLSRNIGNALSNASKATGANTANVLTTAFNTVAESSVEAAEVNRSIRDSLAQAQGFDDYNSMPDSEAKTSISQQAGEAAARTFSWNALALTVPNYIQSRWFTRSSKDNFDDLKKLVRSGEKVEPQARQYLKSFGQGVLSEGLWEENIQSAVSAYEERLAKGESDLDPITGPIVQALNNAWGFTRSLATLNLFGTEAGSPEDEAASAIALGALLGGGMSVLSQYGEDKSRMETVDALTKEWQALLNINNKAKNLLVDNLGAPYAKYGTNKDGTTNYIDPSSKTTRVDPQSIFNLAFKNNQNKKLLLESMSATSVNDPNWVRHNDEMAAAAYAFTLLDRTGKVEDAIDLLNEDFKLESEDAKQLGKEDFLQQKKGLVEEQIKLLDETKSKVASLADLSDNINEQGFSRFLTRNLYYLQAKKRSLQNMQLTNEKSIEQRDAMVQDIDTQVNSILSKKNKLKDKYIQEIGAVQELARQSDEIKNQINEEGKTANELQDLRLKKAAIDYQIKELEQIYGTQAHDLAKTGLQDVDSDSFSLFQPVVEASKLPNFKNRLYYEYGKKVLNQGKLEDLLKEGLQGEDLENALVNLVTTTPLPDSEFVRNVYNPLLEKLSLKLDDLTTLQLEQRERMQDLLESPDEQSTEEIEGVMQSLEQIGNDIESTQVAADAINKALDNNKKSAEKLRIWDKDLSEATPKEQKDYLISQLANYELDKIQALIDEQDTNKDTEALTAFANLRVIEESFSTREDVANPIKTQVLGRIKGLKSGIEELMNAIEKASFDRRAKQVAVSTYAADKLSAIMGLNLGGSTVKDLIANFTANISKEKVLQAIDLVTNSEDGASAYKQLLYFLANNLDKQEYDKFKTEVAELKKGLASLVRNYSPYFATPGLALNNILSNINKYAAEIILEAIPKEDSDVLVDEKSIFYQFANDRDLPSFIYNLSATDLSNALSESTLRKINELVRVITIQEAINELSNLDAIDTSLYDKVYSYVSKHQSKVGAKDSGVFAMSAQQIMVLHDATEGLTSKQKAGSGYEEFVVITGILGSGKSSIGAKHTVDLWKEITGNTEDSIIAFGHSDNSSKVIASHVYSDSRSYTSDVIKNLPKTTKLIVIDEALAMPNYMVDEIHQAVLTFNKENSANVKVLALGDRSQTLPEAQHKMVLASLSYPDTHDTSSMSVVYRTSVPAIFNAAMSFKDKSTIPQAVAVSASMSQSDVVSQESTEEIFGVVPVDEQTLISLLRKPSSRSRAVIVNNELKAQRLRQMGMPENIEILNYNEIQSMQRDEVYLAIDFDSGDYSGNRFTSQRVFNSAMYTSIGRGKQAVFIASPDTQFNQTVNPDAAKGDDKLTEDTQFNAEVLAAQMSKVDELREIFGSQILTPAEAKQVVEEEVEEDDSEGQEPVVDTPTPEQDLPVDIVFEVPKRKGSFTVDLSYPSHHINFGKVLAPNANVYVIPVESDNEFGVQYYVAADNVNGKVTTVGVLSSEDLSDHKLASLVNLSNYKSLPKAPRQLVSKLQDGFDLATVEEFVVTKGKISKAAPLKYIYDMESSDESSTIDDALLKWWTSFVEGNPLATDIEEEILGSNGEVNWAKLKKYVKVQIFSNAEVDNYMGTFKPYLKAGIPYMVISLPTKTGSLVEPQFIRLDPKKMTNQNPKYQILREGTDLIQELQDLLQDPALVLGNSADNRFNNLLRDFAVLYEAQPVDGEWKVVKSDSKKSSIDYLLSYPRVDFSRYDETTLARIAEVLDILTTQYTHGVEWGFKTSSLQEAEAAKLAGEIKSFKSIGGKVYWLDESGDKIETYEVSTRVSPMQNAINSLSLSNDSVNGVPIRVTKVFRKQVSKSGKALLRTKDSASEFYRNYRAKVREILEENGIEVPKKISTHKLAELADTELPKVNEVAASTLLNEVEEFSKKYVVNAWSTANLNKVLQTNQQGQLDARVALQRTSPRYGTGVNEIGSDLGKEENRNKLNELVFTRFQGVEPTSVTAAFDSPDVAPEQELVGNDKDWKDEWAKRPDRTKPVDVNKILNSLANSVPTHLAELAAVLRGFEFNVYLGTSEFPSNTYGSTNPINLEISLNPTMFGTKRWTQQDYEVFVHELIHAVTTQSIKEGSLKSVKPGNENNKEVIFYKRIKYLEKEFKSKAKNLEKVFDRQLKDIDADEFIANLSNAKFREQAKKIKVEKQSIITHIINAILDLLGLGESNVYDALFKTMEDYLTSSSVYSTPEQTMVKELESLYESMKLSDTYEDIMPDVTEVYNSDLNPKDKIASIEELKQEIDDFNSGEILNAFVTSPTGEKLMSLETLKQAEKTELLFSILGESASGYKDKAWTNLFLDLLSKTATLPSNEILGIVNAMDWLHKSNPNYLVRDLYATRVFNYIWDYTLNPRQKAQFRSRLATANPSLRNATAFEVRNAMASLFAENNYGNSSVIKNLFESVRQMSEAVSMDKANVVSFVKMMHTDLPAQVSSNEAASMKFIEQNFGDIQIYQHAKIFVYDSLAKLRNGLNDKGISMTREESYHRMVASIPPMIEKAESETEKAALRALLQNTKGGLPVVYHIARELYPNWAISGMEELEPTVTSEEMEDMDYLEKTVGITKETQDSSTIDVKSRLSDSVKEFLSLIRNPYSAISKAPSNRYLSNKYSFVLTSELLSTVLDLNMDYETWEAAIGELANKGFLSLPELSVVTQITRLKAQTVLTGLPGNIRLYILDSKFGNTRIGVAYDPTGEIDLDDSHFYDLKGKVEYHKVFNTYTSAIYDQLATDLPLLNINKSTFNKLFKQAESSNTLREIQAALGSLTSKDYKIALQDQDWGVYNFPYISSSGFGLEKAIYSSIYDSLKVYDELNGLKKLRSDQTFINIIQLARDRNPDAVSALVSFLGLDNFTDSYSIGRNTRIYNDIVGFHDRLQGLAAEYEIDEVLSDETSMISTLAKILKSNNTLLRDSVVIDANGNRIYRYVPGSFFYKTMDHFTYTQTKTLGNLRYLQKSAPAYLSTAYYKANPFVKGINTIHARGEHDHIKNAYTSKTTGFTREEEKDWYARNFIYGFLSQIEKSKLGRYDHFFYQPSDKPRAPFATINILDEAGLLESIESIIEQYATRDDEVIAARQKAHKEGRYLNFSILEQLAGDMSKNQLMTNKKSLAKKILSSIKEREAKAVLEALKNSGQPIPGNIGKIAKNISANPRLKTLHSWTKGVPEGEQIKNRVKDEAGQRNLNTEAWDKYLPLIELFVTNYYVNSKSLNELVLGPMEFYSDEDNVVKRMSGPLAPGQLGLVAPKFGMRQKFKALIVQDAKVGKDNSMSAFFSRLIPQDYENREEALKRLNSFFSSFDRTDAQGFMTPARAAELQRGYGASYRLGNVMKPVYFGISTVETENGLQPVPYYVKYSSIVLTDDLVDRFPELRKLRNYLEARQIDEMYFASAVKAGKPARAESQTTIEMLMANEDPGDLSVVELDNTNYRLQLNPRSDIDSSISLFTQLTYFLNIGQVNRQSALDVYNAISFLMSTGKSSLDTTSTSLVKSRMKSPGTERLRELLDEGISINNPSIVKKAVAYISSAFENNSVRIKFKGAKLVQQTDQFITVGQDPSMTFSPELQNRNDKRLQYIPKGNRFYAEVIMPSSMVTPDIRQAIANGEDVFANADTFAYRIPSTELHSAVPMKVVGVYDNMDTNVVIAPYELVYLLGSDFDVDSLFTLKKEVFTDKEKSLLSVNNDYVGFKKSSEGLVFDKSKIDEYEAVINTSIARIEKEILRNQVDRNLGEQEVRALKKLRQTIQEKFAKNLIIDTMLDAITKKENRSRMLSPIAMSLFNDTSNKDSVASYLKSIDEGLWPDKLTADMSYLTNSYQAFNTVKTGGKLVGAYANLVKVLAYLNTSAKDGGAATLKEDFVIKYKVNNKNEVFNKVEHVDRATGISSWLYLDALVNLAIDNINEQTLFKLGINNATGNLYGTLIGLGFPVKDATLLIKAPLIQKLSKGQSTWRIAEVLEEEMSSIQKAKDIDPNYVLSQADLVEFVQGKGSPQVNYSALQIASKAAKVGVGLFDLSQMLNVMRRYPSDALGIENMYQRVKSVIHSKSLGKIDGMKVPSTEDGMNLWVKSLNELDSQVEISESFPFNAENLLSSTNILTGLKTFLDMRNRVKDDIYIYSTGVDKFLSKVSSSIRSTFNQRLEDEFLREELSRYVLGSVFYDKISKVKSYKKGRRTYSGMTAFSYRLADKLRQAMYLDRKNAIEQNTTPNAFFSKLVIDYPTFGTPRIRMADGASIQPEDIFELKQAFERLKYIKATETAAENTTEPDYSLIDDLVAYVMLSTGFRFSTTSYSLVIPTEYYSKYSLKYDQALKDLADNTNDMQQRVLEDFEMYLHLNNIGNVDSLSEKATRTNSGFGTYKGYERGLFFDRKYDNPNEDTYPKFFTTRFTDYESPFPKTTTTLYVRLNEENASTVYYQRVGSSLRGAGYFTNLQNYSIMSNFSPSFITLMTSDNTTLSAESSYKLEEGTQVMLVNFDDPARKQTIKGIVDKVKKVGENYEYTVTRIEAEQGGQVTDSILNSLVRSGIIEVKDC